MTKFRVMEFFGGKYWPARNGVFDTLADAIALATALGYKAKVQRWTGSKWINFPIRSLTRRGASVRLSASKV